MAGTGWLRNFRVCFPELSLRKPEPTSIAIATSFNRANVDDFFNNLESFMVRYNFLPGSIYNFDETGISLFTSQVKYWLIKRFSSWERLLQENEE